MLKYNGTLASLNFSLEPFPKPLIEIEVYPAPAPNEQKQKVKSKNKNKKAGKTRSWNRRKQEADSRYFRLRFTTFVQRRPFGRLWIKFCVSPAAATYTKAGGFLRRFGMALIDWSSDLFFREFC